MSYGRLPLQGHKSLHGLEFGLHIFDIWILAITLMQQFTGVNDDNMV